MSNHIIKFSYRLTWNLAIGEWKSCIGEALLYGGDIAYFNEPFFSLFKILQLFFCFVEFSLQLSILFKIFLLLLFSGHCFVLTHQFDKTRHTFYIFSHFQVISVQISSYKPFCPLGFACQQITKSIKQKISSQINDKFKINIQK